MKIGIPKEILKEEYRVSLTPNAAKILIDAGHQIYLETNAGFGSGFSDDQYVSAGVKILNTAQELFAKSEMVLKVKQPLMNECEMLRNGQILFTYLHLAADKELTLALCRSNATCVAYETIEDKDGRLPLLAPMSIIAGRLSVQAGARHLEKYYGGRGVMLSGLDGVDPSNVLVIGGGSVGFNAAIIAHGMKANVTILDKDQSRLDFLSNYFHGEVNAVLSTKESLASNVKVADLIVTAALIPGAKAPKLVTKDLIQTMKNDSVIVDVAIDQGGCVEGVEPTSHSKPTMRIGNVNVYAVPNMPGAVPRTSTEALVNVTLPYVLKIASSPKQAFSDPFIRKGVNVDSGHVTYEAVASALGLEYKALEVIG